MKTDFAFYDSLFEFEIIIVRTPLSFKPQTSTLFERLTLREAYKKLLDLYNMYYEKSYPNWGLAVTHNPDNAHSRNDLTRWFTFDDTAFMIKKYVRFN